MLLIIMILIILSALMQKLNFAYCEVSFGVAVTYAIYNLMFQFRKISNNFI